MATGYVQQAFESIVGNELNAPTLSTKLYYPPVIRFGHTMKPTPMNRQDENRNLDEPMSDLPEIYDPSWDLEMRGYPDAMGMQLKNLLGAPVTTAGDGIITDLDTVVIPAGAWRHTWTAPYGPAGISPLTSQFIIAYKDQATYFKLKGAATAVLSIDSPPTGGTRLKANGLGTYLSRTADPALTPAYEALTIRPFTRSGLTLPTWLASTAAFDDFNVSIANPHETVRTLGIASRFPDDLEKQDPPILITGSVPKRLINSADWDALLAATGFAAEARWTSESIITGSYPYKLILKMLNCQYTDGGPNPFENKRRLGASYNFKATNASGTAGSTIIQLVNATASYV